MSFFPPCVNKSVDFQFYMLIQPSGWKKNIKFMGLSVEKEDVNITCKWVNEKVKLSLSNLIVGKQASKTRQVEEMEAAKKLAE